MASDRPKRLTEAQARAIVDTAELVKAADWSETHAWNVAAADGSVLLRVVPSYGGRSRTARNGWTYRLGGTTATGAWKTREDASVQGMMAWLRWATAPR